MGIYNNLMDQLADKGALFNVYEDAVQSASGIIIPNRKVIINESNKQPIGIVSDKYKVVSNVEIFDAFCKSVEASNIDAEGAEVSVSFSPNGARTLVDFRFPSECFSVDGDDSKTILNIAALNSFDGSTRYLTKAGGFRMKCLNGQLVGDIAGAYSSTHTPRLDVAEGARKVIRMVQEFNAAKGYWGKMLQHEIGIHTVHEVICDFLGLDADAEKQSREYSKVFSLWLDYKMELGSNVYALYNALTDYVTHKKTKTSAAGRLDREKKLARVLNNNKTFLEVA